MHRSFEGHVTQDRHRIIIMLQLMQPSHAADSYAAHLADPRFTHRVSIERAERKFTIGNFSKGFIILKIITPLITRKSFFIFLN